MLGAVLAALWALLALRRERFAVGVCFFWLMWPLPGLRTTQPLENPPQPLEEPPTTTAARKTLPPATKHTHTHTPQKSRRIQPHQHVFAAAADGGRRDGRAAARGAPHHCRVAEAAARLNGAPSKLLGPDSNESIQYKSN